MASAPLIELNDGYKIPQLGLGTWPLDDTQVAKAVEEAVSLGYRHIDTAVKYGNEAGVGEGIRNSGVDRSELFITTKLDGEFQGSGKAVAGLDEYSAETRVAEVQRVLAHLDPAVEPPPELDRSGSSTDDSATTPARSCGHPRSRAGGRYHM